MTDVVRRDKAKKRKRPRKQTLLQQADQLCGQLVRSRGRCENPECGKTTDLQWAHGFSRSYRRIRHDPRNGICLCRSCHHRWTMRPLEWDDFLRAYWGPDLYAELRDQALHGERADLKKTVEMLQLMLAREQVK